MQEIDYFVVFRLIDFFCHENIFSFTNVSDEKKRTEKIIAVSTIWKIKNRYFLTRCVCARTLQ